MTPPPFFHAESGAVRFWVVIKDLPVGASIGRTTLHYRYHPQATDDDPLQTYLANAGTIDEAVRKRVLGGSIEPVMLRDADVSAPPH